MKKEMLDLSLLDKEVLSRCKYFSQKFSIPLHLIINNILISHWSMAAARVEVKGVSPSRPMPEFEWEILPDKSKRLITSEKLFNILRIIYKQELSLNMEAGGTTTSYLPDKIKAPLDEAIAEANKLYEKAKTLPPAEAQKLIYEGKAILQKTITKIKQTK